MQTNKKSIRNNKLKKNGARYARPIGFVVFVFLIAFLAVLQRLSWQFHGAKRLFVTILAVSRSEATLLAVLAVLI